MQAMKFREALQKSIQDGIGNNKRIALLFSGGTDSLTCLFALMDLGIHPVLYSFHLQGIIHQDIHVSRKVAQFYNLRHILIEIPKDRERLIRDVVHLIRTYRIYRKTNIQCTYPFYYVLPEVKESVVVSGLGADDLYGTTASVAIRCKDNPEEFNRIRMKTLKDPDASAIRSIRQLVEDHGKRFVIPYRAPRVVDEMMRYTWRELNQPKQKILALRSFAEYFKRQKIYRRNSNLQVGSKIREWHDTLIRSPLNKNKRMRVDEIYKDVYREFFGSIP